MFHISISRSLKLCLGAKSTKAPMAMGLHPILLGCYIISSQLRCHVKRVFAIRNALYRKIKICKVVIIRRWCCLPARTAAFSFWLRLEVLASAVSAEACIYGAANRSALIFFKTSCQLFPAVLSPFDNPLRDRLTWNGFWRWLFLLKVAIGVAAHITENELLGFHQIFIPLYHSKSKPSIFLDYVTFFQRQCSWYLRSFSIAPSKFFLRPPYVLGSGDTISS